MAKKSKFSANPGTGISSILMIFVVLCMTTFGVLSFVSARADLKLTEANEQTVAGYYAAEEKAQRTMAQLDNMLKKVQELPADAPAADGVQAIGLSGTSAKDAAERVQTAESTEEKYAVLASYAAASLQENAALDNGKQAVFTFSLNDTHELRVTVKIHSRQEKVRCSIASEQICETGTEEDQPLNVWPGN